MLRREFLNLSAASMFTAALVSAGASADEAGAHDHAAMSTGGDAPKPPHRYDSVIAPLQACTAAAEACIAHCQILLSTGDKSMGKCLGTALDCDVVCSATLKAAALNSDFTPALAKTSVEAMNACVEACKPHIGHHIPCKNCYDACNTAIAALKTIA